MENFLDFLSRNQTGIITLMLILAFLVFVVQWLAWIFRRGRFAPFKEARSARSTARDLSFQVIVSEFTFRVIRDFRNFLALVLVSIFAIVLVYVMFTADNQEELTTNLQTVMATLGGLIGSIIGYYFGESAVKGSADSGTDGNVSAVPVQQTPTMTQDDLSNLESLSVSGEVEPIETPPGLLAAEEGDMEED